METYRELSERKRVINAHLALGQRLLDHGHYKEAADEFGHSLQLSPSNLRALECKRKTDLFIALERLEWEPGRAVTYREAFLDPEDHNILLFMGKLRERVSDNKGAKSYFERAQTKYKEKNAGDYYDALNSLGWQAYFRHDLKEMIAYFTKMRDMAPYDYRGYHGLGYALYMQACQLARDNDSAVFNILNEATELLRGASFYVPLVCVINTDMGEVARVIDPDYSIEYHLNALRCIEEDDLYNLEENKASVGATLLNSDQAITLSYREDKIAWVKYLLALDHYTKAMRDAADSEAMARHDQLISEAEAIRRSDGPEAIYRDQKVTVERLLASSRLTTPLSPTAA